MMRGRKKNFNKKFMAQPVIIFFCLLLVSFSCSKSGGKPKDGDFFSLQDAGISYVLPAGWKVVDPPLSNSAIYNQRSVDKCCISLDYLQKNIAVGAFYSENDTVVVVACQGPWESYNPSAPKPLIQRAQKEWENLWWKGNLPLVTNRIEDTMELADGYNLAFRQARMLPGLLAGDDVVNGIAFGEVRGRYLVIASGRKMRTAEDEDLLTEDIEIIAEILTVEGNEVPKILKSPT